MRTCWFLRKCCASVGCFCHGWRRSWSTCEGRAVSRTMGRVSDAKKGPFSAFRDKKMRRFPFVIAFCGISGCLQVHLLGPSHERVLDCVLPCSCDVVGQIFPESACVHGLTIPVCM
ncbi:unnamed protein product [Ectocarpus sp. 13 AM-2016]